MTEGWPEKDINQLTAAEISDIDKFETKNRSAAQINATHAFLKQTAQLCRVFYKKNFLRKLTIKAIIYLKSTNYGNCIIATAADDLEATIAINTELARLFSTSGYFMVAYSYDSNLVNLGNRIANVPKVSDKDPIYTKISGEFKPIMNVRGGPLVFGKPVGSVQGGRGGRGGRARGKPKSKSRSKPRSNPKSKPRSRSRSKARRKSKTRK